MRFALRTRPLSLRLRVLLAFAAGLLASIALVGALGFLVFETPNDYIAFEDVEHQALELADVMRFGPDGRPVGLAFDRIDDGWEVNLEWAYADLRGDLAFRVLDDDGRTALLSGAGEAFWAAAPAANPGHATRFGFEFDGNAIVAASVPVTHEGRTWTLQAASSKRLVTFVFRGYVFPMLGIGISIFALLLLLVFGIIAWLTLRYALRPLHDVSARAAAISPRALDARLPLAGVPADVVPLIESVNHVLDRLESGYRVQQAFLAAAAHELKTPLALIRAQIESRDPAAHRATLLADVDQMSRQVRQLLLLAETSEPQNYRISDADVQRIASDVRDFLGPMAEAAGVGIALSAPAGAITWRADRGALHTLLKNLIENAIQHAPRGSAVALSIATDHAVVRDQGAGVAAEDLGRMFDRFWRGPDRRDHGAGLGLAICQEIVRAHGWRLTVSRTEPGLAMRIDLRPGSIDSASTDSPSTDGSGR